MNHDRIAKLQDRLAIAKISELLVTDYYNVLYFINHPIQTGERFLALLVRQDGKPLLVINKLFTIASDGIFDVLPYGDEQDPIVLLAEHLLGETIAVDKSLASGFLLHLMEAKQARYVDGSSLMEEIRAVKEAQECAYLLQASIDNDEVMRRIVPFLREGIREIEVAQELHRLFEKVTGRGPSFEPIVAFGENGADPHAISSQRALRQGDCVIIDMGCYHKNYCSDMTRTFFYGENALGDLYQIVLKANMAAIRAVRPGVRFSDIDKAARDVIEEAGYGPYFFHRTGHGIGLQVHEPYDVSASNHRLVEEGMCFSIEPGIYLKDRGGIRIEDLVIVDKNGAVVLNAYPKSEHIIRSNYCV